MKKSLLILAAVLTCFTTFTFAGNKHDKSGPSQNSEHEITVGNAKSAAGGSNADDKIVKEEMTHANKGKRKAMGHSKK